MSPPLIVRSTFNFAFVFLSFFVSPTCNAFQLATWFFSSLFKVNLVNVLCQNSAKCLAGVLTVMHVIGIQLRFINTYQ